MTMRFHKPPREGDSQGLVDAEQSPDLQEDLVNVDGELFCHDGEVRLRVLPRQLRVFCDPARECHSGEFGEQFEVDPRRWSMLLLFCFAMMVTQVVEITFSKIAPTTAGASLLSDPGWRLSRCSSPTSAAPSPRQGGTSSGTV